MFLNVDIAEDVPPVGIPESGVKMIPQIFRSVFRDVLKMTGSSGQVTLIEVHLPQQSMPCIGVPNGDLPGDVVVVDIVVNPDRLDLLLQLIGEIVDHHFLGVVFLFQLEAHSGKGIVMVSVPPEDNIHAVGIGPG